MFRGSTSKQNSLPDDCIFCEWKEACHNGCTYHRIGGINGKYYYCKARKEIFAYLKAKIRNIPKFSSKDF